MATTDGPARAHDRNGRRRPFASWMKRLANLKSSNDSGTIRWSNKRHGIPKTKNRGIKNNPYPLSGNPHATYQSSDHASSHISEENGRQRSHSQSAPSVTYSGYENHVPATSAKSTAPTISTNGETAMSEAAYSKAGTMATTACGGVSNGGGEGSTFSSPAPSVRSLTTTLTVQSAAPSTHIYNTQNPIHHSHHYGQTTNTGPQVQFTHQFPPSPATAVPPHLAPHGQSVTYNTATANNILTDNASILTLASSSKRRRRNSLDTNCSVRALAPSSVFGGSRESLPLSVLSGVGETSSASILNAPGVLSRPSLVGLASVERASLYSSSGAGAGTERGSLYTNKQTPATGDGASIRSGVQSHARQDSNATSITGVGAQSVLPGRFSRRSSGWGEITGDGDESDEFGDAAKAEAQH
ncbi:hypothetical protein BDW59DRAFT_138429 [Aspergillus cavernicola]|uniref:Ca2+-modulated nonselective cation channel polycystin n=1 Tax=Aspergillus cavernicola TaxID=176166 RepID=A0ABR4J2I5_9EURO